MGLLLRWEDWLGVGRVCVERYVVRVGVGEGRWEGLYCGFCFLSFVWVGLV